jgi:hypothetical protein
MPSTKKLTKSERKFAKRRHRREYKRLWASMSSKERREFGEAEKKSLKTFLKEKGRL